MASLNRSPYQGKTRKLVLAFDIGTTFSGASYSVLDPGQVPEIKGVTRHVVFPSQDKSCGEVPTVVYYDDQGNICAMGAETTYDGLEIDAAEGKWNKAEWFKLHLRSNLTSGPQAIETLPPLPPNKQVVDIISDFLKYLYSCSKNFIQESHPSGADLWKSVEKDIDFVLSHPNGWDGKEQSQMRQAAVKAGLIPDAADGQKRISFVSEGEASLHFAIQAGMFSKIKVGEGVVVVDAGGGTIDVSAYRQDPNSGNQIFEEIAASQCLLHGSVFVNMEAKTFLDGHLKESQFHEDLDHIVRCFDQSTKLRFKSNQDPQYIKFGSARDTDKEHNIQIGQLKLEGSDVALFFYPSVTSIIQAVLGQRSTARNKIVHVIFVGGFSSSDWLFNSVSEVLTRTDPTLKIFRPEEHRDKAVSYGAISFYLDHFVRARISKVTYGSLCSTWYNKKDLDHFKRASTKYVCISGETRIPDHFSVVLPKNTQVSEDTEFRSRFRQVSYKTSDFKLFSASVWCYRGAIELPKWKDVDPTKFVELCTISVDLSHLHLKPKLNPSGKTYYEVDYEIVLLFGLTELKAQVAWKEKGVEKRSPANIIYDRSTS
ncbi:hypothetical protein D9613_001108 [Agrocybe pediades]|uniref:Heat shock 70 kDa protein 12A n=1 Tax=Agrocybe pediades TaxID=84607 RepID=A0A8H4R1A4_9AGAR|nr:hypothetical protein D9613_001108 [Agrocybe pediades]